MSGESKHRLRVALPLLSITPPSMTASTSSVAMDDSEDTPESPPQTSPTSPSGGPQQPPQRCRHHSLGSLKMFLHHSAAAGSLLHLPGFSTPGSEPGSAGGSPSHRFSFSLRRFSSQSLTSQQQQAPGVQGEAGMAGQRALVDLILEENLEGLQELLEGRKVNVDDRDENGATALHVAAAKGKVAAVRKLLSAGADVNSEDLDNWSALLCAAKEGHSEVCEDLLAAGADIEHKDMGGWTALLWAGYKGRLEVARCLLMHGADVHAQGNFHISSLIWAAGRGHAEMVALLIEYGAKAVTADKYGTSALVWASRNGSAETVDTLIKNGANVDAVGMYSWTALLVAAMGGHTDVVTLLLKAKANVNAKDKDGCTALAIACKEGYEEIVSALLAESAHISIQDRAGDTCLIHAVKGGHRPVVEALIKKYADTNITGKDRKTALYWAVEKSNYTMVKLIMTGNPDLEIATKDGDTPLLKGVRNRSSEIVQLLLDKKAKVHAADKKGDTCLHIAMRARSKAIVEVLLRNPKHSQLLYRPNKNGETPYTIDMKHPKTILGQIFGQRRLNTSQDNEKLLGYDLYSSALADIMSSPMLTMPITVGLFARWGSGKSFLLDSLKDEMRSFTQQWVEPTFGFSALLFLLVLHLSLLVGVAAGLAATDWLVGLCVGISLFALTYLLLTLVWYGAQRLDWYWPYNVSVYLAGRLARARLVLQVLFCHPAQTSDEATRAQPIKFHFTEQARVSTSAGGESCLVTMLGSLYDALEADYGVWASRLYRAFRPPPVQGRSQWRRLCCVPYCVLWLALFLCALLLAVVLFLWLQAAHPLNQDMAGAVLPLQVTAIALGLVLSVALVANLFAAGRAIQALLFSQRRQLLRSLASLGSLRSEAFMHHLKAEVTLLTQMVSCLDSFSAQQTRLVVVVDGLDSAEQDRVLQVLDAVSVLFSEAGAPFIIILAIDPHHVAKALDASGQRVFSEGNITGHSYVRNLVHLPFFLQNCASGRARVAQQQAARRLMQSRSGDHDDTMMAVSRRLSTESGAGGSAAERLKAPGQGRDSSRKGSSNLRRLWPSESVASSLASNLNRAGTGFDPSSSKGFVLADDYFSDVTPRSMRRLMNVVLITSRLLHSFQVEFNWYHLATWVNLTEQWPYRLSWMILYIDTFEETLEDNVALKNIFEKLRHLVPSTKDTEPLLELDRDEKKLEIFLSNHRANLLVGHLRLFLPFTINLDPYLKKVIKEEHVGLEEMFAAPGQQPHHPPPQWTPNWREATKPVLRRHRSALRTPSAVSSGGMVTPSPMVYPPPMGTPSVMGWHPPTPLSQSWEAPQPLVPLRPPAALLQSETCLSTLNVDGVCELLTRLEEFSAVMVTAVQTALRENNISGKVLALCDLNDLKQVMHLSFGDWELFKWLVTLLRQQEMLAAQTQQEDARSVVRFAGPPPPAPSAAAAQLERKGSFTSNKQSSEKEKSSRHESRPKQSMLEKQVSVEEQLICGALQTLSEEACEDVLQDEPSAAMAALSSSPVQMEMMRPANTRREEEGSGTPGASRRHLRAPGVEPASLRKRPVSLLVAASGEGTDHAATYPDYSTPPASPRRLSALRRGGHGSSSNMTAASSLEKLKDRLIRTVQGRRAEGEEGDDQLSDESTPLVSELSTPTTVIPPVTMTLASPQQPSSSASSASSSVSLTQALESHGEMATLQGEEQGRGGGGGPQCLPETQV